MIHQPKTREEAMKYRYRERSGDAVGHAYDPSRCAAVAIVHYISLPQCQLKPGKGPDGLYCGIHAKKVK